jgi:hypothetical protein
MGRKISTDEHRQNQDKKPYSPPSLLPTFHGTRVVPILFKTPSGKVYSDWITKKKMKEIVWEMFQAKALNSLTPRGRLECVLEILLNMAVLLPGRTEFYIFWE